MLTPEQIAPETIRPIRRVEYERMVELGLFEDERVELLRGVLVEMSPRGAPHVEVVRRLLYWLMPALGERALVQAQSPIALADDSEPEPDMAVIPTADYSRELPTTPYLVIEVADSSLRKDLGVKAALYAEAAVGEYWVIDVNARTIDVHTDPTPAGYRSISRVSEDHDLAPERFPDVAIRAERILPTR